MAIPKTTIVSGTKRASRTGIAKECATGGEDRRVVLRRWPSIPSIAGVAVFMKEMKQCLAVLVSATCLLAAAGCSTNRQSNHLNERREYWVSSIDIGSASGLPYAVIYGHDDDLKLFTEFKVVARNGGGFNFTLNFTDMDGPYTFQFGSYGNVAVLIDAVPYVVFDISYCFRLSSGSKKWLDPPPPLVNCLVTLDRRTIAFQVDEQTTYRIIDALRTSTVLLAGGPDKNGEGLGALFSLDRADRAIGDVIRYAQDRR